MNTPLIQWPSAKYWDKPWNPIIGCHPASPACEHCYAKALMARFPQYCDEDCFPSFRPMETARLNPPRKGVVFCGNMTDLFGDWVRPPAFANPWDYIGQTAGTVGKAVYLWCTKRADRLSEALDQLPDDVDWCNQFFGFTAENQECYDERHLNVLGKPDGFPMWTKWWVSCEPLLEPIHLWMPPAFRAPSWIVVGCESGRGRRPCKLEWVESIVEQCRSAGVPVFVKQLDLDGECVRDINRFPEHLRIRQIPWEGLIHA